MPGIYAVVHNEATNTYTIKCNEGYATALACLIAANSAVETAQFCGVTGADVLDDYNKLVRGMGCSQSITERDLGIIMRFRRAFRYGLG